MIASDEYHMAQALALARRGLGTAWPNPSVGCVIVSPCGEIVGRGYTAPGGRPHAEAIALDRAGIAATGATLYITLEPCAHEGRGPLARMRFQRHIPHAPSLACWTRIRALRVMDLHA